MEPRTRRDQPHPRRLASASPARGSALPPGVNATRNLDGPPSRRDEPYEHYKFCFTRAERRREAHALLEIAAQATRHFMEEYEPEALAQDGAEAVERLLTEKRGYTPAEAGIALGAPGEPLKKSEAWVRKERRRHGFDPENGEPDDNALIASMVKLVDEVGMRPAARQLGMSHSTLEAIVNGKRSA